MIARRIFLICCLVLCILLHAQIEDVDNNQNDHPLVECETTKGSITIEVIPNWSPLGAERFLQLIDDNFFTNIALYRCVKRFLTQFGISDNPTKRHWHHQSIKDDPHLNLGIKKNYVSFAGGGPNTRSTQIFIAFEDLDFLGKEPWETPFGRVIKGQETLDAFYKGYGDIPPFGNGPDQGQLFEDGNAYIRQNFPKIDFINTCSRLAVSISEEKDEKVHDPGAVDGKDEDDGGEKNSLIVEETPVVGEHHDEPSEHKEEIHEDQPVLQEKEKSHLRERIVHIARDKKLLDPSEMSKEVMLVRLLIAFILLSGLIILFIVLGRMKVDGGSKSQ